jgi:hypothetical protein
MMKSMMKNVATLLICLISFCVFAGSSPDVSVVHIGNKSVALSLENAQCNIQVVKLTDKNGAVLLTDRIDASETSGRRYNLSNLRAGAYVLTVEDAHRTVAQPLVVTTEAIEVSADNMRTLFAPSIRMYGEKLDYTLLCLDQATVSIEIIDEIGRKNYTKSETEHGSVQRRFNITALTPGTYTLVTRIRDDQFEKRYTEVFTIGETVAGK